MEWMLTKIIKSINQSIKVSCWALLSEDGSTINTFISGMHHNECIVPNVDINL